MFAFPPARFAGKSASPDIELPDIEVTVLGLRVAGLAICVLLGIAGLRPAMAQQDRDVLRVSWRDAVPALDPYQNSERTGLALSHEIWDTLIDRDPETFQFRPLLAVSWRQIDSTTLVFKLRPHVVFHDGSPFTADDVVYTVAAAMQGLGGASPVLKDFLAGATKIDDLDVSIQFQHPFPPAMDFLAMAMPILPKTYRERVGAAAFAKAPIGTGPYRLTRFEADEIDFVRNDAYFDGPKGKPAISRVVITQVPDITTEVTDLLGGKADWIWMLGPEQAALVREQSTLQTVRADSMRIAFLMLDAAGRSPAAGPLAKLDVRRALFYAINRDALNGDGRTLDAPCYPTQFGCDQNAAVHYDYDPARARQMIVDAGYPNGFDLTISNTLRPREALAIQSDLRAAGITVRLVHPPLADLPRQAAKGQVSALVSSWGNYSVDDVSAMFMEFFSGGSIDLARDPVLEQLVKQGDRAADPDTRRRFYDEAIQRITANAYFLPLYADSVTYGARRDLLFQPEPDELPRFYAMRWK